MNDLQRFYRYVPVAGPVECWNWTGRKNVRTGRAVFRADGKSNYAARWLWQKSFGTLLDGDRVLHSCDNVLCVNLEHLFIGTQLDNIRDRDAKGRNRLSATHCVNGHEMSGPNVSTYGPAARWRKCLACARAATARFRAKQKEVA